MGIFESDHQIDIYEAAENFTTIGAGIVMWRRNYNIFRELGLHAALSDLAVPPSGDEGSK